MFEKLLQFSSNNHKRLAALERAMQRPMCKVSQARETNEISEMVLVAVGYSPLHTFPVLCIALFNKLGKCMNNCCKYLTENNKHVLAGLRVVCLQPATMEATI